MIISSKYALSQVAFSTNLNANKYVKIISPSFKLENCPEQLVCLKITYFSGLDLGSFP